MKTLMNAYIPLAGDVKINGNTFFVLHCQLWGRGWKLKVWAIRKEEKERKKKKNKCL